MISLVESQLDRALRNDQPGVHMYYGAGYGINLEDMGLATRAIAQVAKGNAAVQKLLRGAKKVGSKSKIFYKYQKDGNIETAMHDFNSVLPKMETLRQNMHYPTDRLVGTIGNIRLVLMKNGDSWSRGSPVLEIRSAYDKVYDKIVYKKPKN